MPTIGPFIVDAAEGVLIPARGAEVIPAPDPSDPPIIDTSRALAQASTVVTATMVANEAAALTLTAAYHDARGTVVEYRGVDCFVVDVRAEHREAHGSGDQWSDHGIVVATWTLAADPSWIPEESP